MLDHQPSTAVLARIAFACSIAATLGDFGELWTANAGRAELHLVPPPDWLIVPATLAGALGIPLYSLGYHARACEAFDAEPRRAGWLSVSGLVFAVLGGMVHGVTGVLIHAKAGGIASGLDPIGGILASGPIVVTLWALALLAFLVTAALEASLPQAPLQRLRNPLVATVVLTAVTAVLPLPWRDIVGPAAFNIAHVVFFAGLSRRR